MLVFIIAVIEVMLLEECTSTLLESDYYVTIIFMVLLLRHRLGIQEIKNKGVIKINQNWLQKL